MCFFNGWSLTSKLRQALGVDEKYTNVAATSRPAEMESLFWPQVKPAAVDCVSFLLRDAVVIRGRSNFHTVKSCRSIVLLLIVNNRHVRLAIIPYPDGRFGDNSGVHGICRSTTSSDDFIRTNVLVHI